MTGYFRRALVILCFFLFSASKGLGQKAAINYGLAQQDSVPSIAVKLLQHQYGYSVAYTTEGYWQSDHLSYIFLAFKSGIYYMGAINAHRTGKQWSMPIIQVKKVRAGWAKGLFSYLEDAGLWKLNRDSLNCQKIVDENGKTEDLKIFDATNYRFELIKSDDVLMIDSYAPEDFLNYKQDKGRALFIRIRDQFLKTMKKH